jgi:hypothetical protein
VTPKAITLCAALRSFLATERREWEAGRSLDHSDMDDFQNLGTVACEILEGRSADEAFVQRWAHLRISEASERPGQLFEPAPPMQPADPRLAGLVAKAVIDKLDGGESARTRALVYEQKNRIAELEAQVVELKSRARLHTVVDDAEQTLRKMFAPPQGAVCSEPAKPGAEYTGRVMVDEAGRVVPFPFRTAESTGAAVKSAPAKPWGALIALCVNRTCATCPANCSGHGMMSTCIAMDLNGLVPVTQGYIGPPQKARVRALLKRLRRAERKGARK